MATLDLEDVYLLVPIFEEHRKFLHFQWCGTTYEFSALRFGFGSMAIYGSLYFYKNSSTGSHLSAQLDYLYYI